MWESFQDDKHVSPAIQYNVDCVTLVNIEIPVGVGKKPDETSDDSVNIWGLLYEQGSSEMEHR